MLSGTPVMPCSTIVVAIIAARAVMPVIIPRIIPRWPDAENASSVPEASKSTMPKALRTASASKPMIALHAAVPPNAPNTDVGNQVSSVSPPGRRAIARPIRHRISLPAAMAMISSLPADAAARSAIASAAGTTTLEGWVMLSS